MQLSVSVSREKDVSQIPRLNFMSTAMRTAEEKSILIAQRLFLHSSNPVSTLPARHSKRHVRNKETKCLIPGMSSTSPGGYQGNYRQITSANCVHAHNKTPRIPVIKLHI